MRIGWWIFILLLAGAAAFIAYSLIGMVVLGVFGYYATRPIYRRLDTNYRSRWDRSWPDYFTDRRADHPARIVRWFSALPTSPPVP